MNVWKKVWPACVTFTTLLWFVWALATSVPYRNGYSIPWNQDQRTLLPPADYSSVWFQPNIHNRDIAMAILGALVALVLVYGLFYWLKRGSPVFLFMVLGAIGCSFTEPYNSLMVNLYYIRYQDWQAFEFLGRPMPLWLVLLYIVMYGTFGVVAYHMLSNGATKKKLWTLYLIMGLVDAVLEIPLCNTPGLYVYYGNEMLMFKRYPVWMFALNGVSMVAVAAMVVIVEKNIKRWWHWFIIPLLAPVMCIGTGYGIIIWPGEYMVNNFHFSPALTTLGGVVACMLCFTEIWAFSQILCTDGRFDFLTPIDENSLLISKQSFRFTKQMQKEEAMFPR